MFKKILTLLTVVAVLSGMTASSVFAAPLNVSVSASPSSFDPSKASTTLTLTTDAEVGELYGYILYPNYQLLIFSNHVKNVAAGTQTFTWYGRSANSPTGAVLPEGEYMAKVFAKNANLIVGVSQAPIEIKYSTTQAGPVISDLKVDPLSFDADGKGSTEIKFGLSATANLTVSVKKAQVDGTYLTVRTFAGYNGESHNAGNSFSINWDGKGDDGQLVAAGTYQVSVTATNADGSDTKTTNVTVGAILSGDIIKNFTLDPSGVWDPSEENLQIEFDLDQEVDSLMIQAQKGNGTPIDILDDSNVNDDSISEEWDGTDEDGDYVSESKEGSEWKIIVTADGEVLPKGITIKYKTPGVADAFVTKDSFDPAKGEYTTLVYKVNTASSVTVEVLKGSHREVTLEEDLTVSKNKWYTAKFYGQDKNGDDVDYDTNWKFRIIAKNLTDDKVESKPVDKTFKVEEDEVSSGKANVTNDALEPPVFESTVDGVTLSYCIDETADVFAAIYKGSSAGSNSKITLSDYVEQDAGCHTINWNGKDKNNKKLDDGTYTWKLISKTSESKKDNETGKFVVGKFGTTVTPVTPAPTPETGKYDCSMYSDLYSANGTELCDSIGWATARGIVHGYDDGSFKSYQNITRAEVIKMILEAFNAMLLPANGSNLGFSDLNPYKWYMTYLRTAQFYGIFEGFEDSTARPNTNIDRVQALKFVLEASDTFTGQVLKGKATTANFADVDYSKWYAQYVGAAYTYQLFDITSYGSQAYLYPNRLAQRGEIILMLYRLNKAGFIK